MYRVLPALLLLVIQIPVSAQWQSIGALDSLVAVAQNQFLLSSGSARLQITVLAEDLIRVRLTPGGVFEPDASWAVVRKDWPSVRPRLRDTGETFSISTNEMTLVITRSPIRLTFVHADGRVMNTDEPARGMAWNGSQVRVWKIMPPEEHYIGFGEKAGRMQRKFTHMTMWNSDIPAYRADTDPLYQSIPFFYGIQHGRAYGIFLDNSHWSSFDMGKEARDRYSFGAEAGELDYYFFSGPSPREVLSRFTELVGRMPLPPRWSLGFQQSRWSYATEEKVRDIARGFRTRGIPCDVLYLDIDYMDGYRIFTWDRKNFPDPEGMIRDLRRDGFRIAVILDPGIKTDSAYHAFTSGLAGEHFLKYPDGRLYTGKVWPGECAFPDFSSSAAQAWWGNQFAELIRAGVRGWWTDMNEPSVFDVPTKTIDLGVVHDDEGRKTTHARNHNLYGLQMTKATYEGVSRLLPAERPFVLTRASFAGGHRYSAAWTGDNIATWEHLDMAVSMCLNLSISGQPFVGTDIGGFIGRPSGELFARWLQLAVFHPLMRAHSEIRHENKEPWQYGDEYTEINRATINLRYRLLPYLYNAMEQAARTGIPPLRPLLFDYPEDWHFHWSDDEFLFGNDLLVAPVLWPGATTRDLRLPEGEWYDFWTNRRYRGGRHVTVDAPIDRIPIFVKAGAILPTQQVVQYSDEAPIDPLTLTVYPSASSSSTSYEDDGLSFDYTRGVSLRRTHGFTSSPQQMVLRISKPEGSYIPPSRTLVIRIVDVPTPPKEVRRGRTLLERYAGVEETGAGWQYDASTQTVEIRVEDSLTEQQFTLRME